MRVSSESSLIPQNAWKARKLVEGFPTMAECDRLFAGIDLSGRKDLTSLVFIGELKKFYYIFPFFWTPQEGLRERAKEDHAPYDVWHENDLIRTTPGKVVKYNHVAKDIGEIVEHIDDEKLAGFHFDRWRIDLLRDELEEIGLENIELIECGQGFKDMSPCIDAFEEMVLNGEIFHDGNPVMNMCIANAIVTTDPTEARKFNKKVATGRIDGVVALAMAAGLAKKKEEDDGTKNLDDFLNNPIIIN